MNNKSEAQIRNEEEVRRIIAERGYNSASNKELVEKTFGRSFSFKPFIVTFLAVGVLIGGWIFCKNYMSEDEEISSSAYSYDNEKSSPVCSYNNDKISEDNDELIKFQDCLKNIDTSIITVGDDEYWSKYISRYEQMINCYEEYPSVASSSEKVELEEKLAELRAQDDEYRNRIAEIDAELAENLAEIAELRAQDDEYRNRIAEIDAELAENLAEIEAKKEQQSAALEIQKQQEQAAKEAKEAECDNYKSIYGEKTATEIAESDSEVTRAKYKWTNAQKKIRNCSGGNVVYTQVQRELCYSHRDQEVQTAESLYSTYTNLLQQKTTYYRNLKIEACGY